MINPNIKTGDKVMVIGNSSPTHNYHEGEICTVLYGSIGNGESLDLISDESGIKQILNRRDFKKVQDAPLVQVNIPTFSEEDKATFLEMISNQRIPQNRYSGANPFDFTERMRSKPIKSPAKIVKEVVEKKKLTLDTVILSEEKKEEIRAAISQLRNTELIFNEWGFGEVFEKGTAITMLFYGAPGTGKTLMAQAIAEENEAELKIYGMAEIGSSEPGGSERIIQKIFKEAKEFFTQKKQQRVILFDECDSLLYDRSKVGVILGAQINALLSEIEHHEGIVIFTTNRIGTLDPALERRITAKIEFPFPDEKQRLAIWQRMIPENAPISKKVDFKKLAIYSIAGGNIKNAVLNAVRMAAFQNGKQIEMNHFEKAVERELLSIKAFEKPENKYMTSRTQDLGMDETQELSIQPLIDMGMTVKSIIKKKGGYNGN